MLAELDTVNITVPAPLRKTKDPDLPPMFEKSGLKVGEDLFLCFSPERVDPGTRTIKRATFPK